MSKHPKAANRPSKALGQTELNPPTDSKDAGAVDPTADFLANLYAFILSWPEPDADADPTDSTEEAAR